MFWASLLLKLAKLEFDNARLVERTWPSEEAHGRRQRPLGWPLIGMQDRDAISPKLAHQCLQEFTLLCNNNINVLATALSFTQPMLMGEFFLFQHIF